MPVSLRLVWVRVIRLVVHNSFGLVSMREQECPIPGRDDALRRDGEPGLGDDEGRARGFDAPQTLKDVTSGDEAIPHRDDLTDVRSSG